MQMSLEGDRPGTNCAGHSWPLHANCSIASVIFLFAAGDEATTAGAERRSGVRATNAVVLSGAFGGGSAALKSR